MSNSSIKGMLIKELKRLPEHRGLKMAEDPKVAWIRCWNPEHSNGNENSGSCKIDLDEHSPYFSQFFCFGCTMRGPWAKLAEQFKLKGVNKYDMYNSHSPNLINDELKAQLFGEGMKLPVGAYEWPNEQMWRNISGPVMNAVGSKVFYDERANLPSIFFPVQVYDELVGGIKTRILPRKSGKNSINVPGEWAKKTGLFPFDYVRENMKTKVIVLVEGARDALNLIQYGVAALSICGGKNSWSKKKGELIWSLGPKLIIRAYDNDKSGNGASELTKEFFEKKVKQLKLKLPDKEKTGLDASDLTEQQVLKIKKNTKKLLEMA